MTYDQVFDALTGHEFAVIYWSCQGLTYGDIEEKFGYSLSWIQKRATSAHRKLGMGDLLPNRRAKILEDEICPALTAWIENHPDKVKRLPAPVMETTSAENGWSPNQAIVLDPPRKIIRVPKEERKGPRWWIWLILVAGVGGAAYYFGMRRGQGPAPVVIPSPTPESVATMALQAPVVVPSPTLAPTAVVVVVTATLPPPTEPPTLIPAAAIGLPFADSFGSGPDPAWRMFSGDWITANGRLTPLGADRQYNWLWAALEDVSWRNYRVSVDANVPYPYSAAQGQYAIAVRLSNDQTKYLGFVFDYFAKGGWALIGTDEKDFQYLAGDGDYISPTANVELEVNGDQFTARVDGQVYQTITLTGRERGGVALGVVCKTTLGECPSFDDLVIDPLTP